MMDKYGADSLRFWYYTDAMPGGNTPVREEKFKGNRNFVNKIWNAFRFVLLNVDKSEINAVATKLKEIDSEVDGMMDGISKDEKYEAEHMYSVVTAESAAKVSKHINNFRFNLGAEEIREFFWHTICDKWIEEVKQEIQNKKLGDSTRITKLSSLIHSMIEYLKVMHPFIPFITEAVWQELVKLGLVEKGVLMGEVKSN